MEELKLCLMIDACDSLDDIDITDEEYYELLLKNKDRLILALSSGSTNTLSERIVQILKSVDEYGDATENGESPLLKKLIVNMSNELNKESEYIQAVNKLEKIFNDYIGPEKYIQITEDRGIVKFHSSDETHKIGALSSGERHLLVLLTIFVIEGNRRNLFMVDEPEISLNLIWQRKLLPLLSELAPNAEIIVASHSPSIAKENSNYLVELREDMGMKNDLEETVIAAMMCNQPVILVEGQDDIKFYDNIATLEGLSVGVQAIENIADYSEGCEQVCNAMDEVETLIQNDNRLKKYVMGIIDRDVRQFLNNLPSKNNLLVLKY